MVGRAGGDSSESHDTDHLADEEPLDELDSPPLVSIQFETVYYSVLCIKDITFNLNYVNPLPTKERQHLIVLLAYQRSYYAPTTAKICNSWVNSTNLHYFFIRQLNF